MWDACADIKTATSAQKLSFLIMIIILTTDLPMAWPKTIYINLVE